MRSRRSLPPHRNLRKHSTNRQNLLQSLRNRHGEVLVVALTGTVLEQTARYSSEGSGQQSEGSAQPLRSTDTDLPLPSPVTLLRLLESQIPQTPALPRHGSGQHPAKGFQKT